MSHSVAVVASDSSVRDRLAALIPTDQYQVTTHDPSVPDPLPHLFVIALPGLQTPEEQVIESLRADETTANIPIIIASTLPMIELQSVPYASDWTIAIVEEPVQADILLDTMGFLLSPQ
jgi:hypothetical protein